MVCEYHFISDPLYHHTWSCLQHYNFKEATFTAERIFAENPNDEAIYLLATCFYRESGPKQAKNFILRTETNSAKCRYLLAKCYMDIGNYSEAENTLLGVNQEFEKPSDIVDFYKDIAPFVLRMLAEIYKHSERRKLAIIYFKKCLELNPLCWTSYTELVDLSDNVEPVEVFSLPKDAVLNNQSCLRALNNKINMGEIVHSNCPSKKRSDMHDTQEDLSVSRENVNPKSEEKFMDSVESSDMIHVSDEQLSYSFNRSDHINNSIQQHILPDYSMPRNTQTRQKIYAPKHLKNEMDDVEYEPIKPLFGNVCLSSSTAMYGFLPVFKLKPSIVTKKTSYPKKINIGRPSFSKTAFSTPKPHGANNYINRICHNEQYSPIQSISPLTFEPKESKAEPSLQSVNVDTVSQLLSSADIHSPGPRTRLQATKAAAAQRTSLKKECTYVDDECLGHGSATESDSRLHSIVNYLQLLVRMGRIYKQLRLLRLPDCIAQIKQLPRKHSDTGVVSNWLAKAYTEMNNSEKAYSVLSMSYQSEPWQLHCVVLLSSICWTLNKESELACLAKDIMNMDRTTVEYWCVLGNFASLSKESDAALRFFQRVIQINPSYANGYLLIGQEYFSQDELDKAMTSYRRALDLDSYNYRARYFIATVFQKQNKYIEAESILKDALKIFPDSYHLLTSLAVVRSKLSKNFSLEAVLELLDRACYLCPDEPRCRYLKARSLYEMNRYQESLNDLKMLLTKLKEARVYLLMSSNYKQMGDINKAMLYKRWAIDLDPKCSNETFILDRNYNSSIGDFGNSDLSMSAISNQNTSVLSNGRQNSESMQSDMVSNSNHGNSNLFDAE